MSRWSAWGAALVAAALIIACDDGEDPAADAAGGGGMGGAPDTGRVDMARASDGGAADRGVDSGIADRGPIDNGLIDSGLVDSALIDGGLIDSDLVDSDLVDSGPIDSGLVDSALIDGGAVAGYDFRDDPPEAYAQVDRIGGAQLSRLLADLDAYNAAAPADDVAGAFEPAWADTISALHQALDDDLVGLGLTPCALQSCLTQITPTFTPDTLRLDPAAPAGFSNGRRLGDPAFDQALAAALLDLRVQGLDTLVGLLDPAVGDVAPLAEFPYLAPPHGP